MSRSADSKQFAFLVPAAFAGQRLDRFVAEQLRDERLSRSRLQELIRQGLVLVDGRRGKPSLNLRPQQRVEVSLPPVRETELVPTPLAFPVLYEDQDLLVLSKPPGVVVHPACGHREGTLVHGVLSRCASLAGVGGDLRPGIVHRLDKDTSGVMVVAKSDPALQELQRQFQAREVEKVYHAIVAGIPPQSAGTVALPLGRHPVNRKKMAVRSQGRPARTHWRLLEAFDAGYAYLELRLETGRTHQIRVHMAALGHPVAVDPVYGGKARRSPLPASRQCLHASILALRHPRSGRRMRWQAPLWPDLAEALAWLRQSSARSEAGEGGV